MSRYYYAGRRVSSKKKWSYAFRQIDTDEETCFIRKPTYEIIGMIYDLEKTEQGLWSIKVVEPPAAIQAGDKRLDDARNEHNKYIAIYEDLLRKKEYQAEKGRVDNYRNYTLKELKQLRDEKKIGHYSLRRIIDSYLFE